MSRREGGWLIVESHEQASGASPTAGGQSGASNVGSWLLKCLFSSLVAVLAIAAYFQVSGREEALDAATWGLSVVMILWLGMALMWGQINTPAPNEPDLSGLLRNAANVVITVDGVVLGLVYAFLSIGKGSPTPLVIKVGALALVIGVVLALLLYSLVAGKITTPASVAVATGLFSLIAWALAYGLLCIVFALIFPS
jgi:hypothetical protein